jgi:membrane protein
LIRLQRILPILRSRLLRHRVWLAVTEWSKHNSLPGLRKIPLYNLVGFLLREVQQDALITRANSMAFSFFLAIFPGIIFLITLLPYLPYGDDFFSTLQEYISNVMPGEAGDWVFKTVENLLSTEQRSLLSLGFFLAIWFSSNGMLSMMKGLKKDYREVFKHRNAIQQRLIAIQLTFILSFTLFAAMVLVTWGNKIINLVLDFINADWLTRLGLGLFRWVVILVLFYSGITILYRYGAATRKRVPFFNAGATLATLLAIAVSWGFSFYADNISSFNTIYGSIGTIMALMLWIQLNCMVVLIGFELNAGIAVIRSQRKT